MKKKVEENFRVVVVPVEGIYLPSSKPQRNPRVAECEKMIEQIKRHCDDIGEIDWKHDTREICSFCEEDWETWDNGSPACCQDAMDEWEAEHPACKGCPDKLFFECRGVEKCERNG